ncbi:phage holin family protein [Desulfosporosinus fructosivorans]
MNVKEFGFSAFSASLGTILCSCLGGWDASLKVLIVLMVLDYVSGFLGAIKNKRVNSEIMFWGGIRKGLILAVVVVAVLLDGMVGNPYPILRTLAIYFYVAREGISVTENLGILGVPLPPSVRRVLVQLQKEDDRDEE